MTGTLYGLGIGPGDPDLITMKARDILAIVPVIAYPAPEGGESLVRAIAAPHLPAGRIEIVIETPMAVERFPAGEVYDRFAAILSEHLSAGRDVAVLCEGDPFFYGSFMYLYQRLAAAHATVVVPGVSSLTAVAAVAGLPLVSRNEVLTVVPAPLAEAELETRLARTDAAAIMKVGRHLAKVRAVLRRLGLEDSARYVERATMANQRIRPLAEIGDDEAPYFSMILVRRTPAARQTRVPLSGAALLALSTGGMALARRLQPLLPQSRVHGLAGRTEGADSLFQDTIAHLQALFAAGTPIVGICAAGILIRALAPLLADKRREPPVVAVAEDGSAAVPLLGGHHGANRLARAIAAATGGVAAITTAGDVRLGFGLDDPPPGWRVANPEAAKAVTAALLAGEPVRLEVETGDAGWLTSAGARFADVGEYAVRVTDRAVTSPHPPLSPEEREQNPGRRLPLPRETASHSLSPRETASHSLSPRERDGVRDGKATTLVLHPPVLALGVGCERGVGPMELIELARATLADARSRRGCRRLCRLDRPEGRRGCGARGRRGGRCACPVLLSRRARSGSAALGEPIGDRVPRGGLPRRGGGRGARRRRRRLDAGRRENALCPRHLRRRSLAKRHRCSQRRPAARPAFDRRHRPGRRRVADRRGRANVARGQRHRRIRPLPRADR